MSNKLLKLENPERVNELSPETTLRRIGLRADDVFCDIGAGSGLFVLPAAKMTSGDVYALEIDEDMLTLIRERADAQGLYHLHTVAVRDGNFGLPPGTADIVLLATVLHEIEDQRSFLADIYSLLKAGGRLAVIEFRAGHTPFGPSPERRMSRERIEEIVCAAGFAYSDFFTLGPNFIAFAFSKH